MLQCRCGKLSMQYCNLWSDLEGRATFQILVGLDPLWVYEPLKLATGGLGNHERVRLPR